MLRGWGSKPASSSSSSLKLFYADEPFHALPPRPQGLRQEPKNGTAPPWKEGFVTLNPRERDEYKVFVQWSASIPQPVYKTFVERACAQAAREHGHGFVLIRSSLHATSRAGTKPTISFSGGNPVPVYQKDDPHITAGFGPTPLPHSTPTSGRVQTESAHVYCGYPPSSHGGPNRRPAKGTDDYSIMTIWREGCLGSRWGSSGAPKERITWWRVAGSVRELDWGSGRSGAR